MLYHITNVGPDALWKIEKAREHFPSFRLVHRDHPFTQEECSIDGYDEGVAILNGLHSMGFERKLTDQELFNFFSFWFRLKKAANDE
jgi:hypothetical protein